MFKKPKKQEPKGQPAKSEQEVVVMPGVDFAAVSKAWGYLKRSGETHRPLRDRKD